MDRRHYVDVVRIYINVCTSFFSGYTSKPILLIRIVLQVWNLRAEAESEMTATDHCPRRTLQITPLAESLLATDEPD